MPIGGWRRAAAFHDALAFQLAAGIAPADAVARAGAAAGGARATAAADWARQLASGQSFAATVPGLEGALLAAGERAGRLPAACRELATWCRQSDALLRSLALRCLRPALMLHLALVVPAVPGAVLGTHSAAWLLAGPAALWLLLGALALALRRLGAWRTPGLAWVLRPWVHARTARAWSSGVAAGMLAADAVELAAGAAGDPRSAAALHTAARRIRAGEGDAVSAAAAAGWDDAAIGLLRAGVAAGSDAEALGRIADRADATFAERSALAAQAVAGAVTALAMLIAAVVVIGMFLRYYIAPLREAAAPL